MSKFFINRPVTAIVISILIVLAGIIMAQRLPIAQFPSIAPPEIVVTTNYVGADALTIESAVATPIEEAMAGVEGMLYMRSFNANDGTMKLRIDFDLDLDPNIADVFSEIRVNRALPQLPPSVRDQGVTIAKSHVSPPDDHRALLPEGYAKREIPSELRVHQYQRPLDPCAWYRIGDGTRGWRLCHAAVGQARPIG